MVHMNTNAFHGAIFAWLQKSSGPPSRLLEADHLERGGMLLHDAVGIKCEKGAGV